MRLSALFLGLTVSSAALAHPGGHGESDYRRTAPAAAPAPTVIPETYAGVVTALRERATAADVAFADWKIIDVRRAVQALKDLSAALPAKAEGLPAEARTAVAEKTASLQLHLDALIIASDKGNAGNGKAALAAIQADLDALAAHAK